jgi:hypothetical protein
MDIITPSGKVMLTPLSTGKTLPAKTGFSDASFVKESG